MTTALVLSGGASQGSFEVGALEFLYQKRFFADIICSTSVGSVNGLLLAHGGSEASQKAAFDTLKSVWTTELMSNEDMYVETAAGRILHEKILPLVSKGIGPSAFWSLLPGLLTGLLTGTSAGNPTSVLDELSSDFDELTSARSVFTIEPVRGKIRAHLHPDVVATSGVQLRMVTVSLDSGAIRYVKQDGHLVETDGRPVAGLNRAICRAEWNAYEDAVAARDAAHHYERDPNGRGRVVADDDFDEKAKKAQQAKAALDACLLASGQGHSLSVSVEDGAMASSSIPCFFPPTMLGNEAYVDGGIRWTLPLLAAIDFDPEHIIAINTGAAGVPPASMSYSDAKIFDIAERAALGLELWETQERHLQVARLLARQRRQQVWVITPRFVVHDGFTIDPGLIDINIAYGYMCAADLTDAFPFPGQTGGVGGRIASTVGPLEGRHPDARPVERPPESQAMFVEAATDPRLDALADAIAKIRRESWKLEHQVFGFGISEGMFAAKLVPLPPATPAFLETLRTLKTVLGLLVEARKEFRGQVPPGASAWADSWEMHRWLPGTIAGPGATPWAAFTGPDPHPAATRPNALLATSDGMTFFLLNPFRHKIVGPIEAFGGAGVATQLPIEYLDALPQGPDILTGP